MGGKRNRARQYLYPCAAGLMVAFLAGCAPIKEMLKEHEGSVHVEQGQLMARHKDFKGALKENEKVLTLTPKCPPADAALYGMGRIEADPANPDKDYRKTLVHFRQLESEFPKSDFAREAAVWMPLLENEASAEHAGLVYLQRMLVLIGDRRFAEATKESENLLQSPQDPLTDAALFTLGLVSADQANPEKDYKKALGYFTRLLTDFPRSAYAEQARVWSGILKEQLSAEREAFAHLQKVRLLIGREDFAGALREGEHLFALFPKSPPGDAALFGMALVYADQANPGMDYRKAVALLSQLGKLFPQSPLAEDARLWLALLKNEVSVEHEGRLHLQRMQALIRKGDFEGTLREDQKVLASSVRSQPVDAALFSMGLVYLDRSNPKKDYKKAVALFTRLRRECPGSPFAEEARIWIGVLETMEKALRVDMEIKQ